MNLLQLRNAREFQLGFRVIPGCSVQRTLISLLQLVFLQSHFFAAIVNFC